MSTEIQTDASVGLSVESPPRVLLVGNPNTGKTSLFNSLAGTRARTANYPGITVDFRQAEIDLTHATADRQCSGSAIASSVVLVDLPGLYSLDAISPEEQVTANHLRNAAYSEEVVVVVVDATNLSRNLVLASEVLELNHKSIVAVNLIDVAEANGIILDLDHLQSTLKCPVVAVSARTGKGLDRLRQTIAESIKPVASELPIARESCVGGCTGCPTAARFRWADEIASDTVDGEGRLPPGQIEWLDRWFTHPVIGLFSLASIMLFVFFLIFSLADFPMSAIESGFGWLGARISDWLPTQVRSRFLWYPIAVLVTLVTIAAAYRLGEVKFTKQSTVIAIGLSLLAGLLPIEDFRSLLIDGVLGGIAGVVVFLPQICILFFFITLLEDSGYMARGALVMERIMRRVGLPGKAFVPMLSAHACAIPGIMAARTIESWRDRLVTILVLPLLTCSARLPVYAMVATLLFGDSPIQAAIVFAAAYLLGLGAALVTAWCLKKTVVRGEAEPMILELPPYRMPSVRNALMTVWDRANVFLRQAGSVILLISVILWAMASYPKLPADAVHSDELSEAQAALEYSLLGRAGRFVEPIFRPLGFDWKIDVGVLSSFAAREVVVSTLSIVYGLGEEGGDDEAGLVETLRRQTRPDGRPVFTTATSLSLLVFFVLAMQCLPTQAVTKRETGSWNWAFFQLGYMTVLAYVAALITFQSLSAFGWNV